MSNFDFLKTEWRQIHEAADKAESAAIPDPRTACFYARRALELAVHWAFKYDGALRLPYQDNLSALVHEPTFKKVAGEAIFAKAKVIITLGNRAVHSHRAIPEKDARQAVCELFHVCYWFARLYSSQQRPDASLQFDASLLPATTIPAQTLDQLRRLETALQEKDEKLSVILVDNEHLDEEIKRLRKEVAQAKKAAAAIPDNHNYSETETRNYFIDLLLKEAGWPLDQPRDREFEVTGMPNKKEVGYVDYVLWGDNGKPLALVEAKRTRRDARVGQQQAKLYADCLEAQFDQRPIIFYSNGYEHWMWDDTNYPPRQVQGFYKKDELELLIQRRTSRRALSAASIDETIVNRYYQTRAIRKINESFEKDHDRKALLVMATGSGKTRTVIALCDVLMKCNWAKRILFLADRVALVNQAVNAFKKHLSDSSPVNLVTDKHAEGRGFVSTYPTMMGLIDESKDGNRRFGVGHFDLVIIDEAHRSVFQKYRSIFDYFDSLLIGLTATPRDEIDRNTYGLFDLEDQVPTDAYELADAVGDGFLVPPKSVSVPLQFLRQGIRYDDLSDEEKDQWDSLEWDEEGDIPDRVEAQAVNKWLFNKDTVDKVLAHLMTHGLKVAGGDRLGKTIFFAKNQDHAEFIEERFNANYPHLKGEFARIITFKTEYAQSLIDNFSDKEKNPHIAVSVDMLDTGIDVPEVVNLVFFKLVRSKTKFWQMIGRGTRLCADLFGPGKDKTEFYIFDFCQNLEFFSQNPTTTDGSVNESLSTRLFKARLELTRELKSQKADEGEPGNIGEEILSDNDPQTNAQVRTFLLKQLQEEVAAMNVNNFVVRAKRKLVEKFARPEIWSQLSDEDYNELGHEIAGLPSELPSEGEEAKRFDLLILNLQLALLKAEPAFARLQKQVITIAGLLEEQSTIPMIQKQLALILDIQTAEWWENVTPPMLEIVRRRIRDLVRLIEKRKRKPVYTDFEDLLGEHSDIELPGVTTSDDTFATFRRKARAFLRQHEQHASIVKLRNNLSLTPTDLEALETLLLENGIGTTESIAQAKLESEGLGLFIRSLVGLNREAAKAALNQFLNGKTWTANQIEFVNLIINHLTENGTMDPALLYESPFVEITPSGPESIFTSAQVDDLIAILKNVRNSALIA